MYDCAQIQGSTYFKILCLRWPFSAYNGYYGSYGNYRRIPSDVDVHTRKSQNSLLAHEICFM